MRFEPHITEGFEDREAMRLRAVQMRLDGFSKREIAEALGFKSGGSTLWRWLKDVPSAEWTKRPNAKDDLREAAVAMRLEGKSYREIRGALNVSKGSLSLWLRDVALTEEHRQRLLDLRTEARARAAETNRARAEVRERRIKKTCSEQVQQLAESELFVAGIVAYWAEGSKTKPWSPRREVKFMNSDPMMIKLFIAWTRLVGVSDDRLSFRLSIHEAADERAALQFWARELDAPLERFKKTTFKTHNPKTIRKNTGETYVGCLSVDVARSVALGQQIAGWFEGIFNSLTSGPSSSYGLEYREPVQYSPVPE